MKSPSVFVGRRACERAIVAAAVVTAVAFTASVATNSKAAEQEISMQIERLRSEERRTRDTTVDAILQDHSATVEQLIPLIDPAKAKEYSDETRCAAAYLLGKLRAVEAVPVLSRALADEPGPKTRSDLSRYDVPVWNALVRIGRPAVPAMIENIETSDHRMLRIGSLDVLNHVLGGKRRLLELLAKLEKRTDDKGTRRRIQECTTRAREHYKENKEPLY